MPGRPTNWRVISVVVWIIYLPLAVAIYFQRHSMVSIGMVVIGAINLLVNLSLLRANREDIRDK